jgi:hypothetical protein
MLSDRFNFLVVLSNFFLPFCLLQFCYFSTSFVCLFLSFFLSSFNPSSFLLTSITPSFLVCFSPYFFFFSLYNLLYKHFL